jgi:hypothetical protein
VSTTGTIPILGPDGQVHSIPQDQASAALAAGGKPVAQMRDPQGQARWIPSDQVQTAQAAGGTVLSRAPDSEELQFLQQSPGHTWVTASPNFPNRQEGIYPTGPGNEWRNDPTVSQFPVDLHLGLHTYQGAKAGLMAATAPFALEATIPQVVGGLAGGAAGSYAGQKIAQATGAGPVGQEVGQDVGGLVGGLYGMKQASSFASNVRAGLTPPTYPGAPLPSAPSPELLQARGLTRGGTTPPPEPSAALGQVGIRNQTAVPPVSAQPNPQPNPSAAAAAAIPRTLSGDSALSQVLSRLDNASLIKIAKSRGISVTQESQLKPGVANNLLIQKIANDFSPDELQEFGSQYLENSRFVHQFSSQMPPEAWSAIAMQSYFPDVKIPQTVLARTQSAMSRR